MYDTFLFLSLLILFPKFLWERISRKKYSHIFERFKIPSFKPPSEKFVIWVHAVSLGETKAAAVFIKELRENFEKDAFIVLTSITETGHAEAKKIKEVDECFYMPFDFSFLMKKTIDLLKPKMVFLIETDFWYNFLKYAKKSGAKTFVVSAKISEKSSKNFEKFSFFTKKLFSNVDLFFLQNELYKKRFQDIGIREEKLFITGNLKFDFEPEILSIDEKEKWRKIFKISEKDLVITIASTHDPEEEKFLKTIKNLWLKYPNLKVFLVPRHPERFGEVASLLRKKKISFQRLTKNEKNQRLVLVDKMGFLPICYQLSSLAIVGGSFRDKIGGHNILEPCKFGLPVFFGPFMFSQKESEEIVLNQRVGVQMKVNEVETYLIKFFENPYFQKILNENVQKLTKNLGGSLARTFSHLKPFLENKSFRI